MGWEEGVLLHILSSRSSSLLRVATTGLVFLPCVLIMGDEVAGEAVAMKIFVA
ncbi:hypothetical protein F2Q69_00006097 [Brassica cretica]|uniref:Uncharacterized protein n=1 Tax=Brassica cretica TaxID=69181 RepID=A0A8S9NX09_BRACR|nr:hypothetical protein F2Q69_00006097 [Brassica cretica]